ncbi:uncharacterized protein MJAP1_001375 [Malassezia japonica]|uniref:type II protein arginine methyltransferase n=1 Tax=Malassezia japonica TaxID=223818 RepID=A0AAF0F4T3_9BASI|nr:uncharacterized protein MJAP1_001375 [Malassezia japonica]WFD38422.1 hypothetical protein MJAP1_001375 [Malassezia japonica]
MPGVRAMSSAPVLFRDTQEHRVQYNYDVFEQFPNEELQKFPFVTPAELEKYTTRPKSVRMLARDFVHDSLYNPTYGYFSRQAVLLPEEKTDGDTPLKGNFPFNDIKSETDFMRAVQLRYMAFEKQFQEERERQEKASTQGQPTLKEKIDTLTRRQRRAAWGSAESLELAKEKGRLLEMQSSNSMSESEVDAMAAGQVWHTPTQLFSPYYGRALARYLVTEYKLHLFPYHDLVLYELGGGAGTLACDVLDYIEEEEPEVYERTRYRIVEISARLAAQQSERLARHRANGVAQVVHKDILQWDEDVNEPCFFVALEVLDNLTHDVIRYSMGDLQPYQCVVSIDGTGDFHELWEPVHDPAIKRYLSLLESVRPTLLPPGAPTYLAWLPDAVRRFLFEHMPFYPNLTQPHFIPTGALQMMDVLKKHFPQHRLVLSDFSSLPDAAPGVNAPVVQTRHNGVMIPVTTYLVLQGFFDIFFPTDFQALRDVYLRVMGSPPVSVAEEEGHAEPPTTYFTPTYSGEAAAEKSVPRYEDYTLSPAGLFSTGIIPPPLLSSSHEARILTHSEFLSRYAELPRTQLRDGSNPLVTWYANACWLLT